MIYRNIIKRISDLFAALISLCLCSPLLVFVIIALLISNKGKPFFFQKRSGKDEVFFKIIKFKTMNDRKGDDGNLLSDAERLTRIGTFIRKTSLDEIPQLLNVIKGDMSLIGPRPLLPEYLPLYSPEQRKRHLVKPGITGWAQVNGRNGITWKKKLAYDIYYIKNISFLLDMKILFKTIRTVIKSEGINTQNHATAEKFNGKN